MSAGAYAPDRLYHPSWSMGEGPGQPEQHPGLPDRGLSAGLGILSCETIPVNLEEIERVCVKMGLSLFSDSSDSIKGS